MRFSRLLPALLALPVLVAPLLTAVTAQAEGTRFYVDCSAKATGAGAAGSPWRSLASVRAHGAFQPGDQILLKRGTTCKGSLRPIGSGAPGIPIRIGAWGSGARPTVAGGGTGQQSGAVQLVDQHDWVVSDLHVTNSGKGRFTKTYRSGILVKNSGIGRLANIVVRSNTVDHVTSALADTKRGNSRQWGGITVLTTGGGISGYDHVQITSNAVNGVGRTGITTWNSVYNGVHDTDVRISGNTVRKARGDSIVVVGLDGGRIDHNLSADGSNMSDCPDCGGISPKVANAGIWPGGSRNVTIEYNAVYGEHKWGGDGEGFDIDSSTSNIVLQYNYAHDNEGGGVLLCGSTGAVVRFNIFENNKKSAIAFIGNYPTKKTSIYNNTIYGSRATGAAVVRTFNGHHGSGISFKNNLVFSYGSGKYVWPTTPSTSANTLVGVLGSGRPHDSKTSTRDPRLKNPGTAGNGLRSLGGYKPKKASSFPRGASIPSSVTHDFFGKRIDPKRPPRGAAG